MSEPALRLFVALELAAEAREELVRWRSLALGGGNDAAVRAVAPEDLHVTLCFLGAQPRSAVASVLEVIAGVVALPSAALRLGHALWLPRRAPRVLAVSLEDEEQRLGDVRARLSSALAAGGWYQREARPFLPHVTVGRLRRGARLSSRELVAPEPVAFAGRRVCLYRSVLGRAEARYEVLGCVELGG